MNWLMSAKSACCCCCCSKLVFLISLHHQLSWDASYHSYIHIFSFFFFFFQRLSCKSFTQNHILFLQGSKGDTFWIIISGQVQIFVEDNSHDVQVKIRNMLDQGEEWYVVLHGSFSLLLSLLLFSWHNHPHTSFLFCWVYDSLSSCFVFSQYFSSLIPLSSPLLLLLFPSSSLLSSSSPLRLLPWHNLQHTHTHTTGWTNIWKLMKNG